jgi:hypothetical protein
MNCAVVRTQLSAYHDGELAPVVQNAVAEHVKGCSECAAALAGFRTLSDLSDQLTHPTPPDQWAVIEKELVATSIRSQTAMADVVPFSRKGIQPLRPARSSFRSWRALAAAVLLAVGLIGSAYFSGLWKGGGHDDHLAVNFDAFLNQFTQNPQAAQQILLADYSGRKVDLPTATTLVGFQPAVARSLPPTYSVEAVYVLNMPCCKCPQVICRRDGGGAIVVFEHDVDQPVWFGDRPSIQTHCSGRPTRIVEVDRDLLAATWPSNNRNLTVIGARDVEEVALIVAHFDRTEAELQ